MTVPGRPRGMPEAMGPFGARLLSALPKVRLVYYGSMSATLNEAVYRLRDYLEDRYEHPSGLSLSYDGKKGIRVDGDFDGVLPLYEWSMKPGLPELPDGYRWVHDSDSIGIVDDGKRVASYDGESIHARGCPTNILETFLTQVNLRSE